MYMPPEQEDLGIIIITIPNMCFKFTLMLVVIVSTSGSQRLPRVVISHINMNSMF